MDLARIPGSALSASGDLRRRPANAICNVDVSVLFCSASFHALCRVLHNSESNRSESFYAGSILSDNDVGSPKKQEKNKVNSQEKSRLTKIISLTQTHV